MDLSAAAAVVVVVVVERGLVDGRGCPKGFAVTSALPFSLRLSEPPTTGSHHRKYLVVLT